VAKSQHRWSFLQRVAVAEISSRKPLRPECLQNPDRLLGITSSIATGPKGGAAAEAKAADRARRTAGGAPMRCVLALWRPARQAGPAALEARLCHERGRHRHARPEAARGDH